MLPSMWGSGEVMLLHERRRRGGKLPVSILRTAKASFIRHGFVWEERDLVLDQMLRQELPASILSLCKLKSVGRGCVSCMLTPLNCGCALLKGPRPPSQNCVLCPLQTWRKPRVRGHMISASLSKLCKSGSGQ